jgi:hypothetical protein
MNWSLKLRCVLVSVPLTALMVSGCGSTTGQPTPGTGGTTGGAGTTGSGGTTGTTGGGGTTGSGGTTSTTGSGGTPAGTGGTGTGGRNGGTGGRNSGGTTGAAGSGAGGTTADAGVFPPPTGANSIAYIGCSMANNIGVGYKRVGGTIMWNADNYQTGAMVVQNWVENGTSWSLFDSKMQAIGGKDVVKAIMVQICIFSSRATDAELRSMIAAARAHTNPGTHVYLVGQPQYEAGHECSLAGNGGAKWTDDQAKALAADPTVNTNLTYLGKFMLDSTKGEVQSDSCHATSPTGENVLGNQAKAFFGG